MYIDFDAILFAASDAALMLFVVWIIFKYWE